MTFAALLLFVLLLTFPFSSSKFSIVVSPIFAPLRENDLTRSRKDHFFINSSTAAVIALTPVRRVGSGSGSNRLECSDGSGLPDFRLASTLDGSIAPSQNMKDGI